MSDSNRILVGIDGTPASEAALRYAATEANRLDADLQILHGAPAYLPIAGFYPGPLPFDWADVEATGGIVLGEARRTAKELMAAERITTKLATGDPVFAILDASLGARFVVVGAASASRLERIAVGSVVGNVAARAEVPVVAVPAGWVPDPNVKKVVCAVKRIDAVPAGLLAAALSQAAAREATLEVVHVWDWPEAYRDLMKRIVDSHQWADAVAEHFRAEAAELVARHPHVAMEVTVRHGQPAAVLRELSAQASLIVIARRAHAFPAGRFGSTGRVLLRESRCPVEVLPMAEIDRVPKEPNLARAGEDPRAPRMDSKTRGRA